MSKHHHPFLTGGQNIFYFRRPFLQLAADNSKYTLHPTTLCTPEVVAAQLQAFADLAKSSGSNATELYTNGTFGFFVDWAAPVPVLSPDTKVASESVQQQQGTAVRFMCYTSLYAHPAHLAPALRLSLPAAPFQSVCPR